MTKDRSHKCFSTNGLFEVRAMPSAQTIRLEIVASASSSILLTLSQTNKFISDLAAAIMHITDS